jgi:hypothetical protein
MVACYFLYLGYLMPIANPFRMTRFERVASLPAEL